MYPRIPWELVENPFKSAEQTLCESPVYIYPTKNIKYFVVLPVPEPQSVAAST